MSSQVATVSQSGTPTAQQSQDVLNQLGHFIIGIDYRWMILLAIVLVSGIFIFKYIKQRSIPDLASVLQALLAVLMMYTGLISGAAFLLIRPPATDKLSDFELATIGLISLVTMTAFGAQQLVNYLKSGGSGSVATVQVDDNEEDGPNK